MNRFRKSLLAGTVGIAALAVATSSAIAQPSDSHHPGAGPGVDRGAEAMGPGQGMMGDGQGMMDPAMMRMMMNMMHGQAMGPGTRPGMGGMGAMNDDMVVTPIQHLTADDVRHFLEHRLERHGNGRLQIGEVEEVDDDTITAEVVTIDDSLVERFEVDRHSGRMTPVPPAAGGTQRQQPAN